MSRRRSHDSLRAHWLDEASCIIDSARRCRRAVESPTLVDAAWIFTANGAEAAAQRARQKGGKMQTRLRGRVAAPLARFEVRFGWSG